jgi:hypothetical protein
VSAFVTGAYQYVAKHAPYMRTRANTYRNRIARLFHEINDDARNCGGLQEPKQLSELDVSLVDLPSLNLPMQDVLNITFGKSEWPHPTLHTLAQRWRDEARSCSEMRNLLDDPAQASDATVERLLDAYRPMMLLRYSSPTRVRVVPVLRHGDYDYVSRLERVAPGEDGPTGLRDLYTIFGLVRRAVGIYYDESTRLCSHKGCPEYGHNYCNTWMFVPKHHQDCSFRENVRYIRETMFEAEEEEHGSKDHPS